jgi:hypothetical protein
MTAKEKDSLRVANPPIEDELKPLRDSKYAQPIEELTSLLSQNKQAFLLGAGCGKCAGLPLMEELTQKVLDAIPKNENAHAILEGLVGQFAESKGSTIEDYMSELVDLISIAERRAMRSAKTTNVSIATKSYSADDLKSALTKIKQEIEKAIIGCKHKIHNHRQFIRAVHNLQSGKTGSGRPVDYFTLNYDTLLEDALSLEKVPLADGFNGGVTGWWDADAYNSDKAMARVFKIHGSTDWCLLDDDVLPRRIRHDLKDDNGKEPVLIWPAATKYRESQRDPFAQILNKMRHTLRPPQNEVILTIIGYSFGDSHINDELNRALLEADGRLTIIICTELEKPNGLLLNNWRTEPQFREHVRIYARRGFFHSDDAIESNNDLPWWKFEIISRLLGGER